MFSFLCMKEEKRERRGREGRERRGREGKERGGGEREKEERGRSGEREERGDKGKGERKRGELPCVRKALYNATSRVISLPTVSQVYL